MVCFKLTQSVISPLIDEIETRIIYQKIHLFHILFYCVMYYCVFTKSDIEDSISKI